MSFFLFFFFFLCRFLRLVLLLLSRNLVFFFCVFSPFIRFIVPGFVLCIIGRMYVLPFADGTVVGLEFWIARIARMPIGLSR